jgi:tRNA pseudouridine38-40 synthase
VSWLADVLESRDRDCAAPTFMPEGLYLAHVGYPEAFAVPPAPLGSVPWSGIWSE